MMQSDKTQGNSSRAPGKAAWDDLDGRFREIISDPLNLLIHRHPQAGIVQDHLVTLHNGIRVPSGGPEAYYDEMSRILIYNRGVHEPLEEFAFQQALTHLPQRPVMVELGAYWAHYTMWMLQNRPEGRAFLVEPETQNIQAGRANFARNGFEGTFIQSFVGNGHFAIDPFMAETGLDHLDILHSDIQGYELEMLQGAERTLAQKRVGYLFISTHSPELHRGILDLLKGHGYRIEISANPQHQTTSHDGFILAVHPDYPRVIAESRLLGRRAIATSGPRALIDSLLPHLEDADPAPDDGRGYGRGWRAQLRKLSWWSRNQR